MCCPGLGEASQKEPHGGGWEEGRGRSFSHSWSEHTSWGPCPRPGLPSGLHPSALPLHIQMQLCPEPVSPLRLPGSGKTQHPSSSFQFCPPRRGAAGGGGVLGREERGLLEAFCFYKCELSNSAIFRLLSSTL